MATLCSTKTGALTDSTTFGVCNSTAENDSDAATTAISTTYIVSSTFTPGAITIDAILLKIDSILVSSGTLTVALDLAGADVAGTVVVVDVADLPTPGNTTAISDWACFKLAAPVTLAAATAYAVKARTSTVSAIRLKSSVSPNLSRQLRTTTTQLAAAGDKLIIAGELTGAGTGNDHTVTWDLTASTTPASTVVFGSTAFPASIYVSSRGTLAAATTAATTYGMRYKGILRIGAGGEFYTGSVGTPMPSDSTFTITCDSTANVDTGIVIGRGGTWTGRGNTLTTTWDKLAADAAASATSLTTVNSTGWKNGDLLCYSSTTRAATQAESKALTADASGTTLTTAALTNAHSGTNDANGDIRCEVGNLTRNIKITGASSSLQGYVLFDTTSAVDLQYVEFNNLGSATANKRGIDVATTTGSLNFQYNSVHDCIVASSIGLNITGTSGSNFTVSNNVFYNCAASAIVVAATSATHTFSDNLCVGSVSAAVVITSDAGSVWTNNHVNSCQASGNLGGFTLGEASGTMGTFSGNVIHSCTGINLLLGNAPSFGTILNCRVWRSTGNNGGLSFTGPNQGVNLVIDGLVCFGCATQGISATNAMSGTITFRNCVINAGTTLIQPIGFDFQRSMSDVIFENCTFGATNAHATADIRISNANTFVRAYLRNCLLASGTEVLSQTNMVPGAFISSQKHDQTAGLHKTWKDEGTLAIDTTISRTASPSLRMTPLSASTKLKSGTLVRRFRIPVLSGQTATINAYVRESVVGDGTDYNGNRIRLVVERATALGISTDAVLATATIASEGAFELISGTTAAVTDNGVIEFFLDCDGTTGWVNIDDVSWTVA